MEQEPDPFELPATRPPVEARGMTRRVAAFLAIWASVVSASVVAGVLTVALELGSLFRILLAVGVGVVAGTAGGVATMRILMRERWT